MQAIPRFKYKINSSNTEERGIERIALPRFSGGDEETNDRENYSGVQDHLPVDVLNCFYTNVDNHVAFLQLFKS